MYKAGSGAFILFHFVIVFDCVLMRHQEFSLLTVAALVLAIIYLLFVIVFEIQNWPTSPLPIGSHDYIDPFSSKFSDSCECKSLFTIGHCEKPINKDRTYIRNWNTIRNELRQLHSGKYLAAHELYTRISRYVLPTYKISIENETSLKNKTLVSSEVERLTEKFVKLKPQELPYVSCRQHNYLPEEAKSCVERFEQLTGRQLKIAFVGDSTIRVFMEAFVKDFNQVFDFQFLGSKTKFNVSENFLDNKAKFNIPLGGNGLQLQFFWAPFLHRNTDQDNPYYQGAKNIIKSWIKNPQDSNLPDVVYLTFGMWHAVYVDQKDSIGFHDGSLSEMSKLLRILSRITKVLFHVTPPVKHWLLKKDKQDPMSVLDFINQIKFRHFPETEIWMWDSLYPIAVREIKDCESYLALNAIFNTSSPKEMGCSDFMHIGARTRRIGNNLVWNLICNKIMNQDSELCCS